MNNAGGKVFEFCESELLCGLSVYLISLNVHCPMFEAVLGDEITQKVGGIKREKAQRKESLQPY